MNVTFWGVRGAIPTPQRENLHFGGETACVEIEAEGTRILLDAGSGLRQLGNRMLRSPGPPRLNDDILFSHFHWDHLQGIPYFAPLFMEGSLRFHSYLPGESLHAALSVLMAPPFFPLPLDAAASAKEYRQFQFFRAFEIGPFLVTPFPLHHPQGCSGFRIDCQQHSVVYATDHEHGDPESDAILLRQAAGADLLITDAQYTPEEYPQRIGWGHSTWLAAAQLAARAKVKRLMLFHHDPLRDDDSLKNNVLLAQNVFEATDAARQGTTISIDGRGEGFPQTVHHS
jgi:phosphoribosyl 1,2-cyclic phosphodiesterase